MLEFRRGLVSETLRGEYVKSHGEKVIANFLFEHDIPYFYEQHHWVSGRNYRPDFTVPK
jgi:DNA helicase-4